MYELSIAVIRNYPKLGDLKQQKNLLAYIQEIKSKINFMGLKNQDELSCYPSTGSRWEFIPLPFQLLEVTHILWLLDNSYQMHCSNRNSQSSRVL